MMTRMHPPLEWTASQVVEHMPSTLLGVPGPSTTHSPWIQTLDLCLLSYSFYSYCISEWSYLNTPWLAVSKQERLMWTGSLSFSLARPVTARGAQRRNPRRQLPQDPAVDSINFPGYPSHHQRIHQSIPDGSLSLYKRVEEYILSM